jgi:hypothetical protein
MTMQENVVGKLKILLEADASGLRGQFREAESIVSSFGPMFKKLLAGLSFAVLANEIKGAVVEATKWAAEMDKMALKTGMTTEALSRLVEAADDEGIAAATIQQSMKFLNKAIGDAQDTAGQARADFEKLGITFEDVNKKALPSGEVFLQLADAVKKYGTEGEVLNIMQRMMGRGFQEIVPLAERGSAAIKEAGDQADRAGLVIRAGLGADSRQFGRDLNELGDNVKGFVRTVVYTFLPSLLEGSKRLVELAVSMNSLKAYILPAADALKVFAVAGLAAAAIKILLLTDAFVALTWGIRNAAFMIEYFAKTSLLAVLKSPIFLAITAVGLLAAAFVKLRMEQRDAADQAKGLADSYSSGGLDAARTNVSNLSAIIGDLRGKQDAFGKTMDEINKKTPFAHFNEDYKVALKGYEDTKAAADQYQMILDLLIKKEKALADAQKAPLPATTDPKVLEEVRKKIDELKNSFVGLTNPTLAARNAMAQYIADLKKNNKVGQDFVQVEKDLWAAFNRFASADWSKKIGEAKIGASLQQITSNFETLNQDLSEQYARGEVELSTYFVRRRLLIEAQADAEVAALQKRRSLLPAGGPEQIALDQEIANKRADSSRKIKTTNEDERKSWEDLWKTIREGRFALDSEAIAQEVDNLNSAYDVGLISIRTYYDERARLAGEAFIKTRDNLVAEVNAAKTAQEKKAAYTKLELADQKEKGDALQREWQRQAAMRSAEITKLNQQVMLAASSSASVPMSKATAEEQAEKDFAAKKAAIEADYAQKIKGVADTIVSGDQDAADKRLAIAQLHSDQRIQIENAMQQKVKAVQEAALQNAAVVTQGMGQLFGQMYEASGGKMKAFFLLQKSMAIAEIIINTMVAASKAGAMLGPFGIAMATWITSMGYAQAAMVAGITVAGMKKGGPVRGPGTETSDSIPAYLSRGEYVHPAKAVKYYGMDIMEAMRRMLIPKEMLSGFGRFAVATPGGSFAEGGLATGNFAPREDRTPQAVNISHTWVFSRQDIRAEIAENRDMIEGMTIDSLKKGGVLRDVVRRYR